MTIPRHPQTYSHPIYARMLTGVHQAIRYFLLANVSHWESIAALLNVK